MSSNRLSLPSLSRNSLPGQIGHAMLLSKQKLKEIDNQNLLINNRIKYLQDESVRVKKEIEDTERKYQNSQQIKQNRAQYLHDKTNLKLLREQQRQQLVLLNLKIKSERDEALKMSKEKLLFDKTHRAYMLREDDKERCHTSQSLFQKSVTFNNSLYNKIRDEKLNSLNKREDSLENKVKHQRSQYHEMMNKEREKKEMLEYQINQLHKLESKLNDQLLTMKRDEQLATHKYLNSLYY